MCKSSGFSSHTMKMAAFPAYDPDLWECESDLMLGRKQPWEKLSEKGPEKKKVKC